MTVPPFALSLSKGRQEPGVRGGEGASPEPVVDVAADDGVVLAPPFALSLSKGRQEPGVRGGEGASPGPVVDVAADDGVVLAPPRSP